VIITELIHLVGIALDEAAVATCGSGDVNDNGSVTVDEIIVAIGHALWGCEDRE
jgi:hypothetical protein